MFFLLASGYSGVESILKLIGLIILCAVIIAASYFVTRMIGKRETGMYGSSNFKVIDAYRLTPNKYLQLIRIGSRYFCIAVSKDDVTLICELQPEDITLKNNTGKLPSFKDIMAKAMGKKPQTIDEVAESETEGGRNIEESGVEVGKDIEESKVEVDRDVEKSVVEGGKDVEDSAVEGGKDAEESEAEKSGPENDKNAGEPSAQENITGTAETGR